MREILFRGFCEDKNGTETIYIDDFPVKGNWAYGYYVKRETFQINDGTYERHHTILDGDGCYEVIPETVGQYTGLEDTKGNKIFENDIMRLREYDDGGYHDWYDEVYFNEDYGVFDIKRDGDESDTEVLGFALSMMDIDSDYEVVGTIFDKGYKK